MPQRGQKNLALASITLQLYIKEITNANLILFSR